MVWLVPSRACGCSGLWPPLTSMDSTQLYGTGKAPFLSITLARPVTWLFGGLIQILAHRPSYPSSPARAWHQEDHMFILELLKEPEDMNNIFPEDSSSWPNNTIAQKPVYKSNTTYCRSSWIETGSIGSAPKSKEDSTRLESCRMNLARRRFATTCAAHK